MNTTEKSEKKRTLVGRKKAGKKSAGRRRNDAIAAKAGKAANNNGVVLPRMEFEMALELGGPHDKDWTAIVRDAAEAAGGDLLFVLPHSEAADAKDEDTPADVSPVEHAMVRLVEDGTSRLLLVRAGAAGFHLVEEDAIEAGLVRFARASIDVLERLGADNRVVAPLVTLARH
ncbi:MAG TPA: hypothetical protein VLA28_05470 [Afifellaceae bacterium]|nr:hypothetical protein [Afifellaceae bacterium]